MSDKLIKAADELADLMGGPVRSDDGYYDYEQWEVDEALTAYRNARGSAGEVWRIEEYKIWKGIDKEKPCWASLGFACSSYESAKELMDYMHGNKTASVLRVTRSATE